MQTTIDVNGGNAPWFELPSNNSTAPPIHFSPANGFPVASYQEFFAGFAKSQYHITGMDCRATWLPRTKPDNDFTTENFADDLISAIEAQHQTPVIGMGHSHGGAVTIAAACKRPDLFSQLVIVEAASLPSAWMSPFYHRTPKTILTRLVPMIKGSLERQSVWQSRELFIERYRTHNTFKHFSQQSFNDYSQHALRERPDGQFELVFDPIWEAHIFCRIKFLWKHLKSLSVPTLLVRSEHSYLYNQQQFERHNAALESNVTPVTLQNAYHLAPHECPQALYELINHHLNNPSDIENMPHRYLT